MQLNFHQFHIKLFLTLLQWCIMWRWPVTNFKGIKISEKLHFTTINYAPDYTFHSKLFKCTVCTQNYNHYYTLHPNASLTVKLDRNMKYATCTYISLKWHKLERPKSSLPNSFKNSFFFNSHSRATYHPFGTTIVLIDFFFSPFFIWLPLAWFTRIP